MNFSRVLDDLLGQRSKVQLLRFLLRTRGEHTGRSLARELGLDHKTCHAALRGLAQHGVVECRRIGKALVYRLHDGHAIVKEILEPAFLRERALIQDYAGKALRLLGVPTDAVVLFGSVARSEEEFGSDVDLLFLCPDVVTVAAARRNLEATVSRLTREYGSVPQILVLPTRAFRMKVARGVPLYVEILKTGRVLRGKPFSEILMHVG